MAAPLLDSIDITNKTVTADALLTQREFACYLVERRNADYLFTVKGNQKGVLEDVRLYFEKPGDPDFTHVQPPDHGRIETRTIWTTTQLNDYLDFPHVGQAFAIHRERVEKKTGKVRRITLNKACTDAIQRLLVSRPYQDQDPLFLSQRGNEVLQANTLNRLIKQWCKAINLKGNYGAHSLRKTWGYIQRTKFGVGFELICKRFNHTSPAMTMRYLGIEDKEVNGILMNNEIG